MKTSPVSFGSLMAFTINDKKPKENAGNMVKTAFIFNYNLSDDYVLEQVKYQGIPIDSSVNNAVPGFCKFLDEQYKNYFKKNSKKVIMTEADFYVNSNEIQKRYFLTASNDKKEKHIQSILGSGFTLFVAKFYDKK